MKKLLLTMAALATFAIGFTASDDSSSDPEKDYQRMRKQSIEDARGSGRYSAETEANNYIRQGFSRYQLKDIAAREAKQRFENLDYSKVKDSDKAKFKQELIDSYVDGYMDALGK